MGRPTKLNNTEADIARSARETKILEMKRNRLTFAEIGRHLNVSATTACTIYHRALNRVPVMQVHALREESNALMERGIRNLLGIAEDLSVSPRTRVEAWDKVLKYCESQRKLFGLDAPQRREVTVLTEDVVDKALQKAAEDFEAKAKALDMLENRATTGLKELEA